MNSFLKVTFISSLVIARKSALIILIQLLNGVLGYIGLKYIALFMEPWEYGVVGFAYSFVAIFSIFGNLGFGEAHVKRLSEGKNIGLCLGTFATAKLFLSCLLSSIVIGSITIWKFVFNRGFESPTHENAIFIWTIDYSFAVVNRRWSCPVSLRPSFGD